MATNTRSAKWLAAALAAVSLAAAWIVSRSHATTGVTPAARSAGAEKQTARASSLLAGLPVYFVENRGQEDPRVAFSVRGRDTAVYYTSDGVTFALTAPRKKAGSLEKASLSAGRDEVRTRWAVKLEFVGANRVVPKGLEMTDAVFSYMKGHEKDWTTGVPAYSSVVYADLWPGIDLVYGGESGRLKSTLLVKPGADPGRIRFAYRGATAAALTPDGRVEISTPEGNFADDVPYSYQEIGGRREEVWSAYSLEPRATDGSFAYGFRLGKYDRGRTLVVDP